MADFYLDIANSGLGKKLFSALGLPEPVALMRENTQTPHRLSGRVLLGSGDQGYFVDNIADLLKGSGVEVANDPVAGAGHLIFDASGISTAAESTQLYAFFHQHIKSLPTCGRVVVVGARRE